MDLSRSKSSGSLGAEFASLVSSILLGSTVACPTEHAKYWSSGSLLMFLAMVSEHNINSTVSPYTSWSSLSSRFISVVFSFVIPNTENSAVRNRVAAL